MIYGNIIREQQLNSLIDSPMTILREYYENEIALLNDTIKYQDSIHEAIVTESSEAEYIHEGFISNIVEKIKELLQKFIDWVKNVLSAIRNLFKKDNNSAQVGSKKDVQQTKEKVKEKKEQIKKLPEDKKPKAIVKAAIETGLVTKEEVKEIVGSNDEENKNDSKSSASMRLEYKIDIKRLDKSYIDDVLMAMRRESNLLYNAYNMVTSSIPNTIDDVREYGDGNEIRAVAVYKEDIDELKETLEKYNNSGVTWMGGKKIVIEDYLKTEKINFGDEKALDQLIKQYDENVNAAEEAVGKVDKQGKEYINLAEKMKQSIQRNSKTYKDADIITDLHKVTNLYSTYGKKGIMKYSSALARFKKQSKALRRDAKEDAA